MAYFDNFNKQMKNVFSNHYLDSNSYLKENGIEFVTLHGLRHTNVTLMIAKGIQTQIISRKVGHSSVQVTDTYYSHFFESEFKQAASSMDDIFEKDDLIEDIVNIDLDENKSRRI